MTLPLRVLVVAHTHWDREWYHPAGRFRHRLVALVDDLLDDPPPSGESFLLDGQAIVLHDYLEIRPERRAELSALLRDGRLEAGPWYVLADELIPGGEALVRNLLAGRDTLRELRAEAPPVLYCPDAFGHPAALPDLAEGFGLAAAIVWRGYGGKRWPAGDSVRHRSASGAELLLHHLAPDGYELGSSLPHEREQAEERWRRLERALSPRAVLGLALLPNGADHHARQRRQRDAVTALAAAARPTPVAPASLRTFVDELTRAAAGVALPVVTGELRDSYGYTWTLQGTLASRAHQKRTNARLERLLMRDVEPWLALDPRARDDRAPALLRATWRALLEGHPHDTLCGTAIDAVAAALDGRHADVADRAEALRGDGIGALLEHDAERARRSPADWRPVVVVRNRAPRARSGVVELTLASAIADVAVGPGSAQRQGARRRVPPWRVDGMPLQLLERRETVALTESPRDYPDADLVAEVRALGWADAIPGYSVVTLEQGSRARRAGAIPTPVRATERGLDNGLLRVETFEQGIVRLTDLRTSRVIERLLDLEDARDVGDLYTPAIREAIALPTPRAVRVVRGGPLRGEIAVDWPARTGRHGGSGRCRMALVLDAGSPFLRVRIDGFNARRDHRLRVVVRSGLEGARTLADAAFHLVERTPLEIADGDAAMEHVVPTAPLHRFVSRYGADAGVTVFSDGLAEYESLRDGAVALTLVRAVGALSRADLPERPGHAGWPAETPLAQCIGPFAAELAIAPHGADSPAQRDEVERLADDVLLPLTGETLRSNLGAPGVHGGLELVGSGLAFGAAMPARERGWTVLRCTNRGDAEAHGRWRARHAIAEAKLARLDETPIAPAAVEGAELRFVAPRGAIVTHLVRWADRS